MAYKSLFPVTQQFQDKNGTLLVGGKIYIYYLGRTAQADTYKDEAGTVLNSNPVLLDGNGRAPVFVNPIYSYTIVVTNSYSVELFSQDIILHDAISTVEDVVIVGSDGSVLVDTTELPNGVEYDLRVNKNIMATKSSVDDVISDLGELSDIVNTNTSDITNINTALGNKKDRQAVFSASGGPTKTITSLTQDDNGELQVTYQDIDLPPQVPNIQITSDNDSIDISESTDAITNTKTIDLQIKGSSQYGQFSASNVVVGANLSKVKGNLELDNGNIKLKKGSSYHFTLRGEYIAVRSNTIDVIDFIEHSSGDTIKVDVDNTVDGIQNFELSYDVYNLTQDINYSVSFNNLPGIISELSLYVHNIGAISSGSGSGTTYTSGDGIDITNDEISVKVGTGLSIDNDGKIISVGGGNGSGISVMETMTIGSAFSMCELNHGAPDQWAGHGTRIQLLGDLTISNTSKFKISMSQFVEGKNLIFGLYSYNESTYLMTKKAASGIITMPQNSSYITGVLSDIVYPNLNTDEIYYAVIFTNANGCIVRGVNGSNMNFRPYSAGRVNNLGTLQEAPATFTFEGESSNNLFVRVSV